LGDQPDVQYLLSSRQPELVSPSQWLADQRAYWGIETGLHQRLDVSADEDRSRVRHRNAAWVLAMFRRISVVSSCTGEVRTPSAPNPPWPISTKKWGWNTNAVPLHWPIPKNLAPWSLHEPAVQQSHILSLLISN